MYIERKTYRYEIMTVYGKEFTDSTDTAFNAAFRMDDGKHLVTIIDNDSKAPIVARVGNGMIQILRK